MITSSSSSSSSSSSFDDNDDKVVVVAEGVDTNTGGMSRRLQTRSDFDQYIAQFKSPATRRKNNMNNNNDAVIVTIESPVESPVESVECNGIMETKLYRDLHTQRKIARALKRDDETKERRESNSNDEVKWNVTIDE